MTDAELVRYFIKRVPHFRTRFTRAERNRLEALASRLESGVIVPREPTPSMMFAMRDAMIEFNPQDEMEWCSAALLAYEAMLQAQEGPK